MPDTGRFQSQPIRDFPARPAPYLYMMGSLVQCRLKGVRTDVDPKICNRALLQFKDGVDPSKGGRK
jgi:hypothetical protein